MITSINRLLCIDASRTDASAAVFDHFPERPAQSLQAANLGVHPGQFHLRLAGNRTTFRG
jgi:hypothetical protein